MAGKTSWILMSGSQLKVLVRDLAVAGLAVLCLDLSHCEYRVPLF